MDAMTIQIVSVVAILGFLWKLLHEVSNLHKDNAALHKDMADLRQEVGKDMAGLRREVGKDMAGLRQEFGKDMAAMRQEFSRDIAGLRERMGSVEGLLRGLVGHPQESQS